MAAIGSIKDCPKSFNFWMINAGHINYFNSYELDKISVASKHWVKKYKSGAYLNTFGDCSPRAHPFNDINAPIVFFGKTVCIHTITIHYPIRIKNIKS